MFLPPPKVIQIKTYSYLTISLPEQKKIQEEKVKEEEAKSLEPQLPPATEEEQPVPENSQEKQPELPSGE